jgi:FtsZ-binding cell division protein ZapB
MNPSPLEKENNMNRRGKGIDIIQTLMKWVEDARNSTGAFTIHGSGHKRKTADEIDMCEQAAETIRQLRVQLERATLDAGLAQVEADNAHARSLLRSLGVLDDQDDTAEDHGMHTSPPPPKVVKVLKGLVSHVESPAPPFVGDNDHGDMPVPEYAREQAANDILNRINQIFSSADSHGLDKKVMDALGDARHEINSLRTRLYEIKLGYEGCCHACEPVGAENCRLRDMFQLFFGAGDDPELEEDIKTSADEVGGSSGIGMEPEDIMMRNQQLAEEVSRLKMERDQLRREVCHFACGDGLYSYKGMTPVEVAYFQGWTCFDPGGS